MTNFKDWTKVSADTGNDNTKLVLKVDDVYHTTILSTTYELDETKDGKNVVTFLSNRYVVGEESDGITENQTEQDKINDIHKISVLTGLCNLLNKAGLEDTEKVLLTVNMPLNSYIDVQERDRMKKLYEQPETVDIVVNNKRFNFKLKIELYFEGAGLMLSHRDKIGSEPIIMMMLGSYNTSAITFDENCKPIRNQSKCIDAGIIELIANVQDRLLAVDKKTYSDIVTKRIIQKRKDGVETKTFDVAEKVVIEHLTKIKTRLSRLGVDLGMYKIVFAGGGAILLEQYLQKVFGERIVIDNDPLYSDAKGALMFIENK